MKCRIIDNQSGGLVCFVSKEYNEEDAALLERQGDFSYVKIVFIDNSEESILPYIQQFHFSGKIDVCFCEPNKERLNEARLLYSSEIIRSIAVTPNCIYSCDNSDLYLGYECWENYWAPDALHPYDRSAQYILNVKELLIRAGQIANDIASADPKTDLEKIILTDAWIQQHIQYATGKESIADGGVYVCESIDDASNVHDPFLHEYGRCEDIAFSAALILNHSTLGVHCRQVGTSRLGGFNHSWNIIACKGKEYFTDFTHNITRNPHKAKGALRAASYSPQFTLLGIEEAMAKYGTTDLYSNSSISFMSIDREEIKNTILSLEARGVLITNWDPAHIIPSVFIKKQ